METSVDSVPDDMPAETAWGRMRAVGIHHLVVMRGGAMAGVVSARDLGGAAGVSVRREHTVGDLMTSGVVSASPTSTVRQATNLMRSRSIGRLP